MAVYAQTLMIVEIRVYKPTMVTSMLRISCPTHKIICTHMQFRDYPVIVVQRYSCRVIIVQRYCCGVVLLAACTDSYIPAELLSCTDSYSSRVLILRRYSCRVIFLHRYC